MIRDESKLLKDNRGNCRSEIAVIVCPCALALSDILDIGRTGIDTGGNSAFDQKALAIGVDTMGGTWEQALCEHAHVFLLGKQSGYSATLLACRIERGSADGVDSYAVSPRLLCQSTSRSAHAGNGNAPHDEDYEVEMQLLELSKSARSCSSLQHQLHVRKQILDAVPMFLSCRDAMLELESQEQEELHSPVNNPQSFVTMYVHCNNGIFNVDRLQPLLYASKDSVIDSAGNTLHPNKQQKPGRRNKGGDDDDGGDNNDDDDDQHDHDNIDIDDEIEDSLDDDLTDLMDHYLMEERN